MGSEVIIIRVWTPVTSTGNLLNFLKTSKSLSQIEANSAFLIVLLWGLYEITHVKQLAECLAYHNWLSLQLVFGVNMHFSRKKVHSFHWLFGGLVTKQRLRNTVLYPGQNIRRNSANTQWWLSEPALQIYLQTNN